MALRFGLKLVSEAQPDSARFWWTFSYPNLKGLDPVRYSTMVADDSLVEWTHADMAGGASTSSPNDPLLSQQFQLFPLAAMDSAWALSTGYGVTVAVLDDGVQQNHPDLGGRVYAGIDLFEQSDNSCNYAFSDYTSGDCAWHPRNADTHGTNVAGVIAATKNNALGIAGVAPDAWIYPIRIYRTYETLPVKVRVEDCAIGYGISWAWQMAGAQVINNSWNYDDPYYAGNNCVNSAINNAVTLARGGQGAVIIVSAGKSPYVKPYWTPAQYPATHPAVMSINAAFFDSFGGYFATASYATSGKVDLWAPSGSYPNSLCPQSGSPYPGPTQVVTTALEYGVSCPPLGPSFTDGFSGTSASAALVSGTAALILARWPQLHYSDVITRLRLTGTPFYDSPAPRLLISSAVGAPWPTSAITAWINGADATKKNIWCTWGATASGGATPYTYRWTINGATVGTDNLLERNTGTQSFVLTLTVTDVVGRTRVVTKSVTVSTGGPSCLG